MSREAYVARLAGKLGLAGLLIFGYIHGIYWGGGLKGWTGPGCAQEGCAPWQAILIDLSPIIVGALAVLFLIVGSILADEGIPQALVDSVRSGLSRPSRAELRERQRAERQRQLEVSIALLEMELGIGEHESRL